MRVERGLTQLKAAVAVGVSAGHWGNWERGKIPAARGRAEHHPEISRTHLEAIASALDCEVFNIVDRAALTATTRVLYGLDPLGPARTIIGGREFDLTDQEADRVAAFALGLIAGREIRLCVDDNLSSSGAAANH